MTTKEEKRADDSVRHEISRGALARIMARSGDATKVNDVIADTEDYGTFAYAKVAARGSALAAFDSDSCLCQSHPEEPVFVLCGRDPLAVELVDMWAALRTAELTKLVHLAGHRPTAEQERAIWRARRKVHDARNIAQAMENWLARLKKGAPGHVR